MIIVKSFSIGDIIFVIIFVIVLVKARGFVIASNYFVVVVVVVVIAVVVIVVLNVVAASFDVFIVQFIGVFVGDEKFFVLSSFMPLGVEFVVAVTNTIDETAFCVVRSTGVCLMVDTSPDMRINTNHATLIAMLVVVDSSDGMSGREVELKDAGAPVEVF